MAINPPDGLPADGDGNDSAAGWAALPRRRGGMNRSIGLEARPELRDRETYYADLRYAVHTQSRYPGINGSGTWTPPFLPDTWT